VTVVEYYQLVLVDKTSCQRGANEAGAPGQKNPLVLNHWVDSEGSLGRQSVGMYRLRRNICRASQPWCSSGSSHCVRPFGDTTVSASVS
jgi:hypothetical protein